MATKKLQATLLSFALLLPAGSALASTHHHYRHHRHHYSQARGAVIGAVAGAAIDHHQPIKGAIIGGVVGEGVQIIRNHKAH
jgi:Glycine-zipper domain